MRLIRGILSWLLAVFLIAVFLHWTLHPWPDPVDGHVIFYDLPGENIYFRLLAERTGISAFEPAGRFAVGFLFLFVIVMLIIGPLRRFGAGLSFLLIGLFTALQVSPILAVELPAGLEGTETDGGARLYLQLACLTASVLLLSVHPRKPRRGR